MKIESMTRSQGVVLLLATTLIWGTTFPLLKDTVTALSPSVLISARFLLGAIALLPFCRQFNRQLFQDGLILALPLFAAFLAQTIGLETAPANRAAFIMSLNVILVPILGLCVGQTISKKIAIAAFLSFVGIGIMSWEGGTLSIGDFWTFGCAVAYAIYVLLMEAIAPRHSILPLTVMQLGIVACFGLVWSGPAVLDQLSVLQSHWGTVVYLGLIATAGTTVMQVIAQQLLRATEVAIIYTLEPLFGAIFAFLWLGEQLGLRGFMGAAVILVATLLSQLDLGEAELPAEAEEKSEAGAS